MLERNYTIMRNPDFHDGYLTGISVEEDVMPRMYILRLFCQHVDGSKHTVIIPRVRRLRASNFLQGNIILEFRVYDANQCTPELIYKTGHAETLYDEQYTSKELEKVKKDNCLIIEMDSSYGCTLAAIACCRLEDIRIEPVSDA